MPRQQIHGQLFKLHPDRKARRQRNHFPAVSHEQSILGTNGRLKTWVIRAGKAQLLDIPTNEGGRHKNKQASNSNGCEQVDSCGKENYCTCRATCENRCKQIDASEKHCKPDFNFEQSKETGINYGKNSTQPNGN